MQSKPELQASKFSALLGSHPRGARIVKWVNLLFIRTDRILEPFGAIRPKQDHFQKRIHLVWGKLRHVKGKSNLFFLYCSGGEFKASGVLGEHSTAKLHYQILLVFLFISVVWFSFLIFWDKIFLGNSGWSRPHDSLASESHLSWRNPRRG